MLWLFAVGHGLDIHSTWAVLRAGGIEQDANVRLLLGLGGIAAFVLFKLALFVPLLIWKKRVGVVVLVLLAWGIANTFGVVIGNYEVLARL